MNFLKKKHTRTSLIISGLSILLFASCEKENNDIATEENSDIASTIDVSTLTKLKNLGFEGNTAEVTNFILPDGSSEKRYLVEGDIALSESYLNSFDIEKEVTGEQYRTFNLVTAIRTINVIGISEGQFALPENSVEGLRRAIDNYNRLNLDIRFTLDFGFDGYQNFDMVVYYNPDERDSNGRLISGGVAGFPSRAGFPHQLIRIYGIGNSNANVNEHVITHEMGHSIGFRHTDFFSRSSCANGRPEGAGSIGAEFIPGTARREDPTSIMNACFGAGVDGEFNRNDITALNFLY
ncbi:M57 family metalloprotease [Aquimarina agarivorans]|uniref:M57 family metalloprotease n=1 Tax=Aquimarina agarivorans TaxID=980584 RepID=UPI000248ED23|nr:M57 family metalloprotease [Aquimarina agarivorans]